MKSLIVVVLFLAVIFAGALSTWSADALISNMAPDFTLRDMQGKEVALSSFKGKAVLLNFWASWCPTCTAEMPAMNKLHKDHIGKGMVVVAVSTDKSQTALSNYLARNQFDFIVLKDADSKAARQFKVFSIPMTFLLDKNGVIVKKYIGEEDWDSEEIKKDLRKALN
ncbi:MAG: TlpA disulfide reductase family protein [Nitrospirota bacterium]